MRKAGAIFLISALGCLSLAACTGGSSTSPSGSAAATGAGTAAATGAAGATQDPSSKRTVQVEGQQVTIEGEAGAAPILRFKMPLSITKQQLYPVSKGSGTVPLKDGQLLSMNIDVVSPADGKDQQNTWSLNQPQPMLMEASSMGTLYDAVKGGSVHAQALGAVPADSSSGQAAALVYYEVDATQDIPSRASGTAQKAPDSLPKVSLDKNGKPSITPVKTDPPKDLQSVVLIEGTGDYVDENDGVAVNYTGWLWDGKQFDSSWDRGVPATFSLIKGQLIDGWVQGMAKKKVGSQLLLVVPPSLGYGANANGDIPANSTLVFVIDILGRVAGR